MSTVGVCSGGGVYLCGFAGLSVFSGFLLTDEF